MSVVDFADGWAACPLDRHASVSCAAHCEPAPEFNRVLDSVPHEGVHRRVRASIQEGRAVDIDYKPGSADPKNRCKRINGEINANTTKTKHTANTLAGWLELLAGCLLPDWLAGWLAAGWLACW